MNEPHLLTPDLLRHSDPCEDFWMKIMGHWFEVAKKAVKKSELTAEDKFAVAVTCGARLKTRVDDDGQMHWTTEPCSVWHDGHQWRLTTFDENHPKFREWQNPS